MKKYDRRNIIFFNEWYCLATSFEAHRDISSLKMKVRKEVTIDNVSLDLDSGIAIVGVIRELGEGVSQEELHVGQRVTTILKSMMENPRYAKVCARMVVEVPSGVDSAEAAATAYTYLLGFQTLTHGINNPRERFSKQLFRSKRILIVDGASTSGQAVIQLARTLGAEDVYATAKKSRHEVLRNAGARPLSDDQKEWIL